ncbi:LGFP repeat-containing protein [Corynebacterium sp.]|uniref:LGFP repeat-containing protein n=1 Tax=Corynebacterium sp. TaxID=1720 RepID=UPI0026DCA13D|nr:hypothetical protein [Corynebacterium sp.]MDO5031248.1 hypothetical protein [Corynebacterium sp.]
MLHDLPTKALLYTCEAAKAFYILARSLGHPLEASVYVACGFQCPRLRLSSGVCRLPLCVETGAGLVHSRFSRGLCYEFFLVSVLCFFSSVILVVAAPVSAVAQSVSLPGLTNTQASVFGGTAEATAPDAGTAHENPSDALVIPILPEWAKRPSVDVQNNELHPHRGEQWTPTVSPHATVVPGQMRSDRQQVPAGFTKQEADLAETKEARLQAQERSGVALSAAPQCRVYWPSPFEVCGAIRQLYDSLGGPRSFLAFPKSNELTNPDKVGKRSEFVNGFIYWHPTTGAHSVSIPATVVWAAHGWERGYFGYPLTNDIALGDAWFKQDYQGGHIYTRNAIPAVQAGIQGRIYDKWQELGAQNSVLGFPISSEEPAPDGIGRYNLFQRGIMIWHPHYGAHAITGDVLLQWVYSGAIAGDVGYPTGDPVQEADGWRKQTFEKGSIHGQQLEKLFPGFLPGGGLEHANRTLRSVPTAGGQRVYRCSGPVYERQVRCSCGSAAGVVQHYRK